MTTGFSKPRPLGNAFGPGREGVTCMTCGVLVPMPLTSEPDWLVVHREWHEGREPS